MATKVSVYLLVGGTEHGILTGFVRTVSRPSNLDTEWGYTYRLRE